MRGKGVKEGYEPKPKEERLPERVERHKLAVFGNHSRNELEKERDTWWAVSELAKGKTYREIAHSSFIFSIPNSIASAILTPAFKASFIVVTPASIMAKGMPPVASYALPL